MGAGRIHGKRGEGISLPNVVKRGNCSSLLQAKGRRKVTLFNQKKWRTLKDEKSELSKKNQGGKGPDKNRKRFTGDTEELMKKRNDRCKEEKTSCGHLQEGTFL